MSSLYVVNKNIAPFTLKQLIKRYNKLAIIFMHFFYMSAKKGKSPQAEQGGWGGGSLVVQ